jgi:hypothetical protein
MFLKPSAPLLELASSASDSGASSGEIAAMISRFLAASRLAATHVGLLLGDRCSPPPSPEHGH